MRGQLNADRQSDGCGRQGRDVKLVGLGPTRRTFLKQAGASAAAGVLAALSAGTASADEGADGGIQWDEEYDVLIVGGGAAGLACACTLAQEGADKTCLLIEKNGDGNGDAIPGGDSFYAQGRVVYTDDADAFYLYLKELFEDEGTVSDQILRTFAAGAAENLAWVKALPGCVEEEVMAEEPGLPSPTSPDCYPEYPEMEHSYAVGNLRVGRRSDGGTVTGPANFPTLMKECVQRDYADTVTYRDGCRLVELVSDPDTREVLGGAYLDPSGNRVYVKARLATIMCCGGFESDFDMLQNIFGMRHAVSERGVGTNTGDGHRICTKLGAAFWHMNGIAGFWEQTWSLDGQRMLTINGMANKYGITVGTHGRRFCNDIGGCTNGPVQEMGTGAEALKIHTGTRHAHVNFGGEWKTLPMPSKAWFICDANAVAAGALGGSEDPVADGYAYAAGTIEELAAQIDVPTDELSRTVELWNGFVETGEDLQFYRPVEFMTDAAIVEAPFYAAPCSPIFLNTDGGPVHDEFSRTIDVDGNPIPRLYSVGEFGSMWTNMYQGACNLAECAVFGRVAVRHILANA